MLLRPKLKAHLRVQVSGENVFLLWETGQAVLEGEAYRILVTHIDGRRTTDQIVEQLKKNCSPALLYYALAQLERRGYLAEADECGETARELAAFWSIQGVEPHTAVRRLEAATVSVATAGDVNAAPLLSALEAIGVRIGATDELGVVLTDDYLRTDLRAYNAEALARGRPWLLAKPVGHQIWIGPLFRPGRTACWECLARRLRANRPVEWYLASRNPDRPEPARVAIASTAASYELASNLIANEVASWIVRREYAREASLLTLNGFTWKTQTHSVVCQTDCPSCGRGAPSSHPGEPLEFQSCRKNFTRDGGHRMVSPEKTLERFGHHVSELTGIVTALTRYEPSNGVLNVYASSQNLFSGSRDLDELRGTLGSGKSGKGASDIQARVSALCEALERYSGSFRGDETRSRHRFADIADRAIHPNQCMLFSEKQFQERDCWNARETRYNYVLSPLAEDAEVSWTPVWSMTYRRPRYLPTAYCYYNFTDPGVPPFAVACSNGNAAGNTLEEAVFQGFLELIERDSIALWWYNRLSRPSVDLDSFHERYLDQVRDFLHSQRRDLWVLDLTADLGIPVFVALSRRLDRPPERILLGFGAHLDARIALLRAVTELNQMLTWARSMESDPPSPLADSETRSWLLTAMTANQPYIVPDRNLPTRTASDFPRRWHDDLKDDLSLCQSLVEQNGMELLVLDQTRADVGLPVVKVFVPGLRHFWARFAPGRLYDVPVKLGWLTQPLYEHELNPVPMFI